MLSRPGLVVLWLACVLGSADDEACALQTALGKPKIQDNYVYFDKHDNEQAVQSVQFDETSHSISDGQPYEGVFTRGSYLDVEAGRHKTAEVAQYFNSGITSDNALGLVTFGADPTLPSELNFAVSGSLSVAMDNIWRGCPDMKIAQGHHGDKNNWWIAGTKCYHKSGGLTCPCGDKNVIFFDSISSGIGQNQYSNIFFVEFET